MTALKVVHPTQPYGPQAALLAKRADVVGELEAMSRKLAKLAEAQRAEEAVFDEIRRLSEDVGGPPSARRPLSDQIAGIQLWRNNPDGVSRPAGDMPIICATKYWNYLDLPFPPYGKAVRPPDPMNAFTQIKA
jgi:hypothetical protein